jgi:anion-transporting  ArsA/GET3 family ATPase
MILTAPREEPPSVGSCSVATESGAGGLGWAAMANRDVQTVHSTVIAKADASRNGIMILPMRISDLSKTRLHILLGKGGVGKTTVAAALGTAFARLDRDTLICETEGKSGLGQIFGKGALGFREEQLLPHLWARTIKPDEALLQYLEDHAMLKLSRYLVRANLLDYVSTTIPGIKDVIILGKVKQLVYRNRAYERPYEHLILDPPAAGHALTFLSSPVGITRAVKVGPLREQAEEVLGLLADHEMTVVHVVTLPEETPVNEAAEAAQKVVERTRCRLGVVFVNGCYPPPAETASPDQIQQWGEELGVRIEDSLAAALSAAAAFLAERYEMQRHEVERIKQLLGLPVVELPYLFAAELGIGEVTQLSEVILAMGSKAEAEAEAAAEVAAPSDSSDGEIASGAGRGGRAEAF